MITETKEGFKILKGLNGYEALYINSNMIKECINYLYANNLKYIVINPYQGYEANDINFIINLENYLEGITILSEKFDYSIINKLHKIKSLGIIDNKKDVIDLSNFPRLESLSCDYSIRLQNIESCKSLKSLTLNNYKPTINNLINFPRFNNLELLILIRPDITTLHGIDCLISLKKIELFNASKLETISSLNTISNTLEEIYIEQCKKINDFESLGKVKSLKKIIVSKSGEIKSLSFLRNLDKLEFISFWGTNILDGNLEYCKGIKFVGFDNKKHYSHKLIDFK